MIKQKLTFFFREKRLCSYTFKRDITPEEIKNVTAIIAEHSGVDAEFMTYTVEEVERESRDNFNFGEWLEK